MINDRKNELKVRKYADQNHYTILANTFGTLEYVRYCYDKMKSTEFLKWPKGSDEMLLTKEGVTKKIKLSEVEK